MNPIIIILIIFIIILVLIYNLLIAKKNQVENLFAFVDEQLKKMSIDKKFSKALAGLIVTVEEYPKLKANENVIELQKSLNETKKDLFEATVFTSLLNEALIFEYIEILSLVIGYVEELKLNRRIWSKD